MTTNTFLFSNYATTILAAPISAGATSLTVQSGDGAKFPAPNANQLFAVVLNDALTGNVYEVIYASARSGDTFTGLLRGQEGTAATSWIAGDLCGQFITAGQMGAALQRIQLRMDLKEGLGLLRGDPGALSHALMNLCVNAIDAMPGGGTLQLRTDEDGEGGLMLSVLDSGTGMVPEVLAKAMEPFYTTKAPGKGTGLGLAMVYGTMMAHEGAFDLSSTPGHGTEAILRFPASRVGPRVPARDVTPALAFMPHEPLRILLVDDDELIREAVTPLLEMLGHTVTTAPGGAKALEHLRSGLKVDLVILDMNMPGMGGAEALPRILELRPGLPVIMATGYSDNEIAPLLEDRPSVTSIRKPFSLKEIQFKIAGLQIQPDREGTA